MWKRRLFFSLLLLIGLPLLGVRGGFALLDAWRDADAGSWRALGRPAEMPTAIVDATMYVVYVRGQDGSLFVCDHRGQTRDNACWQEVEQVGERDYDVEHANTYRGEIPAPPGTVVETLDLSRHFAERASHARYALLEDGSVWLWDYHADANWSLVLLACGPVLGLGLGVVIVALWWGAAGLRALLRRRQERAER